MKYIVVILFVTPLAWGFWYMWLRPHIASRRAPATPRTGSSNNLPRWVIGIAVVVALIWAISSNVPFRNKLDDETLAKEAAREKASSVATAPIDLVSWWEAKPDEYSPEGMRKSEQFKTEVVLDDGNGLDFDCFYLVRGRLEVTRLRLKKSWGNRYDGVWMQDNPRASGALKDFIKTGPHSWQGLMLDADQEYYYTIQPAGP